MMEKEDNQELELSFTEAESDRLSPIAEMNESSVRECSLIEDQLIGETPSFQDGSIISQESESFQTSSDFKRSFSLNVLIPETPPHILRKRIDVLEEQFEHIKHEHNELQEFTKLEKQIEHHDCVPKIEMRLRKDEFDMVNEKMECLMQENKNLRNEIDLKEQQNQELKRSSTASLNTIQALENFVSQLGHDLKENLQHEAQEIIKNNPALKHLVYSDGEHGKIDDEKQLNIYEEIKDSNYSSIFEGIKHLLKRVLANKCDLKIEYECLSLENKELQTNLEKLGKENKVFEKSISIAECKIIELKEQLNSTEVEVDKLKDLLAISERKLSESNALLHTMQLDNEKMELKATIQSLDCQLKTVLNRVNSLETVLANTKDENTILKQKLISMEKEKEIELNKFKKTLQNSYVSLISELKNIIESLVFEEGLSVLFDNLEKNFNVFDNVDFLLGTQTVQEAISDLLSTLKIKLISFDEHMNLRIYEFNSRSKQSEDEINELTNEIQGLKNTVKDELTSRLEKLECTFHCFSEDVIDFNGSDKKVTSKQVTNNENNNGSDIRPDRIKSRDNVEINNIEKELKSIFNYIDQCLNSNNPFANFKDFIDCNTEHHNFTSLNKLVDKDIKSLFLNLYEKLKGNESFESQKTQENLCRGNPLGGLKDLMMVEILSLDSSESKKNLLKYSSKDIFDKFVQIIMKRQAEVTSELQEEYETCLGKMKYELEVLSKKVKFQSSRISELEYEQTQMNSEIDNLFKSKCEIESTAKSLSKSLENTFNDMSVLKKIILKLTSENNVLRGKLIKCNQLVISEKVTVDYLKASLGCLKKEFQFETKTILALISKLSSVILNKQNSCTCMKSQISKSSEECYEDQECQYPGIDQYVSLCTKCSSTLNNELTKIEGLIEKDKLLLKELILSDSSECSSALFGKLHILQDVAEIFFNKIYELENLETKTQVEFQNTIDTVNRDLSDFKLSIFKLYKEFVPEEGNAKTESLDSISNSGNVMSLQKELECVEEECRELTKKTDKFQDIIKASLGFINGLKDQFKVMVFETSKKDMHIEELYRIVAVEQHKNEEIKKEYATVNKKLESCSQQNSQLEMEIQNLNLQLTDINFVFSSTHFNFPVHIKDLKEKIRYLNYINDESIFLKSSAVETNENFKFFSNQCNLMSLYIGSIEKTMHSLLEERIKLEEQVKFFTSELSNIISILTTVKCYMPAELKDSREKIKYMCNLFKENTDMKYSLTIANESINFFSYQSVLMNDYIKNIETSINALLGQKKQSDYEFNLVKNQLAKTKTYLDEANKVFNRLLSILPSNTSTPVQAVNLVEQIIAKYNTLKASEVNSIKKQKSMEETISKQLEEIKSLNKLNANIKHDQEQFEDNIRNLRSELRSIRLQYQKKLEECNVKPSYITNFESTEFGIQTDVLCCPELEQEILILKETLREHNNKIQFLERRIQSRKSPYKRKPDLELALFQAKERIKELKAELMKKENYNKDLIELFQSKENYSQKYESSSQGN